MMKRKLMIIPMLVSGLFACSEPTSPTIGNYTQAIKSGIAAGDDFPSCIFNYNLPTQLNNTQLNRYEYGAQLKLLSQLGVVTHKVEEPKTRQEKANGLHTFNLTELGKKYYIPDRGICIGKTKFIDVSDVSEPYQERGKTYVRGTYLWTIELPAWAKKEAFYQSDEFSTELIFFKYKKLMNDIPFEEYFVLSLGEEGWKY